MFRRYYEGNHVLRLGYDFYADIAERIAKKQKEAGLTQEQLAKKAGVPADRVKRYMRVQIRFRLDDLDKLYKALDTTTDHLIGAEYDDPDCGKCLYEVWNERHGTEGSKFNLLFEATSPQMAFLRAHKWSLDAKCIWFEARDRARIKLIGVPVRKIDYASFKERGTSQEDEIYPD